MTRSRYRSRRTGVRHHVSVNKDRCRRFGVCEAEAPGLFRLMATGELFYQRTVAEDQLDKARAAARCCPMLAILLEDK
jgi:ferredoxin